jgi:hypothetical protein
MKICRVEIIDDKVTLPQEILDILPQGQQLYARTDTEKGTVIIYANDPTVLKNKWYFDEMAKEMENVDWREYYDDGPIPPKLLGS